MMAFTTLIIALPIVLILYHLIIKNVKYPIISYLSVLAISILFFITRSVHLIYIGLEILIIGLITVYIKNRFFIKKEVAPK
jgi:hypothetical protein